MKSNETFSQHWIGDCREGEGKTENTRQGGCWATRKGAMGKYNRTLIEQ